MKTTSEHRQAVLAMHGSGMSKAAIMRATGLQRASVSNIVNAPNGHDTSMARYASSHMHPSEVAPDDWNSPAVKEGRTRFPTRVFASAERPRLLIPGINNRKTGARVIKGDWAGMPIYTLTLEERKTCPTHCPIYAGCYGNSSHFAPRVANDATFIYLLDAEVNKLAMRHPHGYVVRLHILGDFYSKFYSHEWARMLRDVPQLHIFGYTARTPEDDPEIWSGIAAMNRFNDRCFVRRSSAKPRPGGASVIDWIPETSRTPEGIVCPAQTSKTACCGTCGLCWSKSAREETILFIKHGPRRHR